jgi:hypothetical protein
MTRPTEIKMDATINLHGITITFLSPMTKSNLIALKTQLFLAIKKIERSPFKKVLKNSFVMVGNPLVLSDEGFSPSEQFAYYPTKDVLIYGNDESAYQSIIHEYGHRFHNKMIVNGFKNKALINLYKKAVSSQYCFKDQMPQIGDLLSDLKPDRLNYVLTNIIGDTYIYINQHGKILELNRAYILETISCPSQYGAKNHMEFFAEMVTLITLDLVKPSQQVIADKFMQIVNEESI